MSYGHNDDSENQLNIIVTSLPSSVGVSIGTDNKGVKEGQEERETVSSRKLNSYSDIEDILYDPVEI